MVTNGTRCLAVEELNSALHGLSDCADKWVNSKTAVDFGLFGSGEINALESFRDRVRANQPQLHDISGASVGAADVPTFAALGEIDIAFDAASWSISVPYIVTYPFPRAMRAEMDEKDAAKAYDGRSRGSLNSIALRMIHSVPPGQIEISVIGDGFLRRLQPLLSIRSLFPDGRVLTDGNEIERALDTLAFGPARSVPRLVLCYDIPGAGSMRQLQEIVNNGPSRGVMPVIITSGGPMDFLDQCFRIDCPTMPKYDHLKCSYRAESAPNHNSLEEFVQATEERYNGVIRSTTVSSSLHYQAAPQQSASDLQTTPAQTPPVSIHAPEPDFAVMPSTVWFEKQCESWHRGDDIGIFWGENMMTSLERRPGSNLAFVTRSGRARSGALTALLRSLAPLAGERGLDLMFIGSRADSPTDEFRRANVDTYKKAGKGAGELDMDGVADGMGFFPGVVIIDGLDEAPEFAQGGASYDALARILSEGPLLGTYVVALTREEPESIFGKRINAAGETVLSDRLRNIRKTFKPYAERR